MPVVNVSKEFFAELVASAERAKQKRAQEMPEVADALLVMQRAVARLKDLGFRDAMYCPKDGTMFDAVEAGSTGVHDCAYWGEWPTGSYNVYDAGDVWPSRPILFRLKSAPVTTQTEGRR